MRTKQYWRVIPGAVMAMGLGLAGCLNTYMVEKQDGTTMVRKTSYTRIGPYDLEGLEASRKDPNGTEFELAFNRAHAPEAAAMKPGEWNSIIEHYLAAGLARLALQQIARDVLQNKTGGLTLDGIRDTIGGSLDDPPADPEDPTAPRDPDDWPDWPAGDTRYHIYAENNGAPNQRGLWKPDSDSRPGSPVLLLPAHMSKTGVVKVEVGAADCTDCVRRYPTDLLPILANGLRLHYNPPKVGTNVPIVVTLADGSEYRATVANGTKRQDPLTFEKIKDADPGEDHTDDEVPDDPPPAVAIPTIGSWAPPVMQLPAWMDGKVKDARIGKAYNMTHLGGLKYQGPPMSDPMWNGPWEAYPATGARVHLTDGRTVDSYVPNIRNPYSPMRWYDIAISPPVEATR